jgi:hypothetical protein
LQLVDAFLDRALVGCRRRALLDQHLLWHARVHPCPRRQIKCSDERGERCGLCHTGPLEGGAMATRKATTSKSLIPENSPLIAWVPPV